MTQKVDNDFLDAKNLQMGRGQMILSALIWLWTGWLSLAKPQNSKVAWVGRAWKKLVGDETPVTPTQIVSCHKPSLSKLIQSFLHQTFQGLQTPWSWKAMDRNKTTLSFSTTNTSSVPRTAHPIRSSSSSLPRTAHPIWPSSSSLLRTGKP